MRQQRSYTPERIENALILCRGGWPLRKVARFTGIPYTTIHGWCEKHDIPLGQRGGQQGVGTLSHEEYDLTAKLYEREYSTNEIGRLVGRHGSTIRSRLRMAGIPARSQSESVRLSWKRRKAA